MKKLMNPRLMLIVSMAIFGTLGLFVRNIPVSSGELAFYRAVLASVLIGVFLLVTGQRIPFGKIKKEVPHRGWNLLCAFTFSMVSGSPCSKQKIVLCSAP